MKKIKNEIVWFLVPTFIVTYGLGIVAYLMGGMDKFPLMIVSMFVPALVVILLYCFKYRKPIFKNNDLGLRFRGLKYLIIVPFVFFLLVGLSYLIPFLFDRDIFMTPALILEVTEKTGFGVGNWFLNLLIIFGINTIIAPLQNILLFLGEEIGWRAYLVPRLLKIYSAKVSFLIGGSLWGIWHAAGILLGLNYPDHPILGNIMMMLMCIPLGVILQYFYYKSKSIFIPAIAHGVINWTAGNFIMFVMADENYNKLIYGPSGIIGIIIFYLAAFLLFNKIDWKNHSFSNSESTNNLNRSIKKC